MDKIGQIATYNLVVSGTSIDFIHTGTFHIINYIRIRPQDSIRSIHIHSPQHACLRGGQHCPTIGGHLRGIDALTVTAATSFIGALMLSVVALWTDGLPFEAMAAMDARGWTALAWLVIGATVLAYAWYFEGVKILGAGSTAAYITLVPIFGMLSSAWVLGEPLHISLVAGCAAAVGGMTLMRYGQKAV